MPGQHGDHGFGGHRHIDSHHVTAMHILAAQGVGELADLFVPLAVGDVAAFGRVIPFPDDCDLGAKLVCGGPERVPGFEKGFYTRPTVFSDVDTATRIAQEEIFGPVLCIIPYETIDEAVVIANDTVYGLGAHVQSQNLDLARAVTSHIRAGQVLLNYPAWNPMAPFGGYKRSGKWS
jgi:acyl-CoA reductase-like NAD-dependent aldehyde dehydrogenase